MQLIHFIYILHFKTLIKYPVKNIQLYILNFSKIHRFTDGDLRYFDILLKAIKK